MASLEFHRQTSAQDSVEHIATTQLQHTVRTLLSTTLHYTTPECWDYLQWWCLPGRIGLRLQVGSPVPRLSRPPRRCPESAST